MSEFLEFYQTFKTEIFAVLSFIVFVIYCFIKKKPYLILDTIKELIVRVLPVLINQAENAGLSSGEDKLKYVLSELSSLLKEQGFSEALVSQYLPFAQEQVELILTTPQKKEVKSR